jgi:hypothetical protein
MSPGRPRRECQVGIDRAERHRALDFYIRRFDVEKEERDS